VRPQGVTRASSSRAALDGAEFVQFGVIRGRVGGMDGTLVCIYPKGENNPRMLVGLNEQVGVREKKAFSNLL